MAYYEMMPAGLPAGLQSGMDSVLNKKFGTATSYAPGTWPDTVNLLGQLEEKTAAAASICSFEDGADDVPSSSVKVTIPANLDGVSSVSETQTGKNLFNYEAVQAFNANVIITRSDGDYTMQNNNSYAVGAFRGIQFHLKPATYSLSLGEAITVPIRIYKNGTWFNNGINAGNTSVTFTVSEEADYDFSCNVAANSSLTIKKCQFEVGSTATAYEPYTTPTVYTASLGRTIYGGSVDVVKGEGTDENGNDFTFTGQEINTRLGYNAFWSDEGDTEVTYRSSGTISPASLTTKTITVNGTYNASDDSADGYSSVTVNVPAPQITAVPLISEQPYIYVYDITGTDVTRIVKSYTAASAGKFIFSSASACMTNTASNEGFMDIQKNGVSIVKQYLTTDVKTGITIPDIDVEIGDIIDIIAGFNNYHSSCEFRLYTAIVEIS